MRNDGVLVLGAVAYEPKVVTIWDGFIPYFARRGLAFDYVLYTNYERQVEALFAGHIDVAWNSPLAWLQSERIAGALGRHAEAIGMRDTDRDLTSGRTSGWSRSTTWPASTEIISAASAMRCAPWFAERSMRRA